MIVRCALVFLVASIAGGCAATVKSSIPSTARYVARVPDLIGWFAPKDDGTCVGDRRVDVCLLDPVSFARIAIWAEPSLTGNVMIGAERVRATVGLINGRRGGVMLQSDYRLQGSMRATFNFNATPLASKGRAAVIRMHRHPYGLIYAVGIWPESEDYRMRWMFDRVMDRLSISVVY